MTDQTKKKPAPLFGPTDAAGAMQEAAMRKLGVHPSQQDNVAPPPPAPIDPYGNAAMHDKIAEYRKQLKRDEEAAKAARLAEIAQQQPGLMRQLLDVAVPRGSYLRDLLQ